MASDKDEAGNERGRKRGGFFSRLFDRTGGEELEAPHEQNAVEPEAAVAEVGEADGASIAVDADRAAEWEEDATVEDAVASAIVNEEAVAAVRDALAEDVLAQAPAQETPPQEAPAPETPTQETPTPETPLLQQPEPEPAVLAPAEPLPPAPLEPAPPEPAPPEQAETRHSWWGRLKSGLARSSASITQGIASVFTKRKLDATTLDELEDVLLRADLGVAVASRIRDAVSAGRYDKDVDPDEVRAILAREVEKALAPVALPLTIDTSKRPFVILVIGVNGSGKTTTIGKLAAKYVGEGRKVVLAAGDTFRAAAIEQLQIWGSRIGADVVARPQGADPASLAFDALKQSQASNADALIIDTAGRLQNRTELMAELEKIVRVIKKLDSEAPHAVLLVLDATIGQNALSQVEIFSRVAGVTGLVMTKLDGTARGGILVAVAERFAMPIHYIGVGETVDDLEPFSAADFARAIAGIEE